MNPNEPYPGTQAVLRAIALLKSFTDAQPELSLTELAHATRLKKATAYRLLTALESEGMVARNPQSEAYQLGPAILALGGRALRSNDLRSVAHEELERLAQETRETTTLEILIDEEVLILDEVLGTYLVGTTHFVGTRWPLHATSTGKVMLAYLPQETRKAILRKPLARFTSNTIIRSDRWEAELEGIRQRGYAIAVEELEAGYVAVGAPVRNHDGNVIAAISAGGPTARLTMERITEIASLVMKFAARISARLGFQPESP